MERLTKRYDTHVAVICENCDKKLECNGGVICGEVLRERLAAYEDVMPLERAQELAQAEKDGRMVVLPTRRKMLEYCPMRHKNNGNCAPAGGFCRPDTEICKALHAAYECGLFSAREEAEAALKKRKEEDNDVD